MSVHAMSWVLKHSTAEGNDRLCLLVLANYADDEGLAWPGVERVAREMRVSTRTVQRALRSLEADGHVKVELNGAPDERLRRDRRPNAYRLLTRGDTSVTPSTGPRGDASVTPRGVTRGDTRGADGATLLSPKSSLDPSEMPPTPRTRGDDLDAGFDDWWARYPRKVGRPIALRRWRAARRAGVTVEQLDAGLARWLPVWAARGELEFVPHPSTWLHQRRFDDDPGPPARVVDLPAFADAGGARHELVERTECDTCGSTGWIDTAAGMARCADCNLERAVG